MRIRHVLVTVLLIGCGPVAGTAAAQPPIPLPALPLPAIAVPGLPGQPIAPQDPDPAPSNPPAPGLAQLQQWINVVVPPPPIPVADQAAAGETGVTADLARLQQAVMPSPVGDPLIDDWPADLAALRPGDVIATRDVTATAAPLLVVPVRQALQVKYRTTDAHDAPSYATATLAIPAAPWTGPGSRPVLVNNLPIDALGRTCTPGYTLAHGFSADTGTTDFVPPTTQLALLRGYAVLIPDHEGPRMAYAEPFVAGHAVLDAIRAMRAALPAQFGASRYAMHGYSGGAIATRGAVALIDSYAPELAPLIVGAALGGVPADYQILSQSMNANFASGVFLAATFGVGRERPEILARMNNLARWAALSPLKDTCAGVFAVPGVLSLPIDIAADTPDPLHSALAVDIYRVTRMQGMKSAVPLYVYNGEQEFWIPAAGAREFYRDQCSLGVAAMYRSVPGEHIIAAGLGYPEAMGWVDQRLQGVPAPTEC
ncbi:lipase [Nocardia nova]|uniref:Lipase n=1 Tax=Nocardia nova TaxID=37330 RepID=A0A2S6AGU7_9NOCA|nr:lipase family protein [Nocardia nova]PPJ21644.1 lipase [Nocardia nova]PPJ33984.1 lipase [Nocardia nova]